MTFEERVEAVYDAMCEAGMNPVNREEAAWLLRRGFPDLYGEKPTAWIAPREASEAVLSEAYEQTGHECHMSRLDRERFFEGVRDAHVKSEASK